jgi:hypothetical protein
MYHKESAKEKELRKFESYCLNGISIDSDYKPVEFQFTDMSNSDSINNFFNEDIVVRYKVNKLKKLVDEAGGVIAFVNGVMEKVDEDAYTIKYRKNYSLTKIDPIETGSRWFNIGKNIVVYPSDDFKCNLERKYKNLKIEKVYYLAEEVSNGYGQPIVYYSVSKVICTYNNNGEQQEVEIGAKELMENVEADSKTHSCKALKNMFIHAVKENNHTTYDYFKLVYRVMKLADRKDIEFIKEDSFNLENWVNKLRMAGDIIVHNNYVITKMVTNRKELRLPDVMYVSNKAFLESSINKLIVTSPNTLIFRHFMQNGQEKNKFKSQSGDINIIFENGTSALFSDINENKLQETYIKSEIYGDYVAIARTEDLDSIVIK